MKIAVLSFTDKGCSLNNNILKFLKNDNFEAYGFTIKRFSEKYNLENLVPGLKEWTHNNFQKYDGFCFIGATGIAVRTIAPFIKSKAIDPAVLVIDECGTYVIPILSGHIGGANKLALKISEHLNGEAVITTATDINRKFAVDNFAVKNSLIIDNINDIKIISGRILNNKDIGFYSDVDIKGKMPENIKHEEEKVGICISHKNIKPFEYTMNLIPQNLTLGIGCRKNKSLKDIEELVFSIINENNINFKAVKGIYSIDLKKDEQALIDFSKKYNIPFKVFSKDELNSVQGKFAASSFVKSITGVDNVCERAAVLGSNEGKIYIKKASQNGVTAALAKEEWSVLFE